MGKYSVIGWIAFILVVVGALNWGLIGLFGFNLVTFILGNTVFTRLVYILVGLSALYLAFVKFSKPTT